MPEMNLTALLHRWREREKTLKFEIFAWFDKDDAAYFQRVGEHSALLDCIRQLEAELN